MNKTRVGKWVLIIAVVLIVLILAISTEREKPLPQQPEFIQLGASTIYFPLLIRECGGIVDPRLGLAWGWRSQDVLADTKLCLSNGALSHNWDSDGGYFGGRRLVDLPTLWGPTHFSWWKTDTDPQSSGIHLGPNECDRPDQCNTPVDGVARLMVDANAYCPKCRWISPSYSMAAQCEQLPEFFRLYQEYGGNIDAFIGIGIHIYPGPRGVDVNAIFERCRNILPEFTKELPFWVTEFGIISCDSTPDSVISNTLSNLIRDMAARKDVASYMIYSPYHRRTSACDFTPLFDWDTKKLTAAGRVLAR